LKEGVFDVPITEYMTEQLLFASNKLKGMLRPENENHVKLIQKGLLLYRQGLVYQMKFEGECVVASVQDVTPVKVKLDLQFLEVSECSCPVEGFCRHRMAVFFHALSQVGSVATWVEEWRQPIRAKTAATNWGLKTAKDLLKSSERVKANYEDWQTSCSISFETIMKGQGEPKPYVIPDLFRIYWKKLKADAPLEQEWKTLYELVCCVHSLNLLAKLSAEYGHGDVMITRYYRFLFHSLIDEAEDAIAKLTIHSLPFAFDRFLEKLKDESTKLLTVQQGLVYEGVHLYRLLWSQLFKKSQWRSAELSRLEVLNTDGQENAENLNLIPVTIGLIHQYLLNKEDEHALKRIVLLQEAGVPYLLYWLEMLTGQKEWKRLGPFVEYFASQLHEYMRSLDHYDACIDFTGIALDAIAPYCSETRRVDLFERILFQTLPYSYREYDTFLYERKNFDKWAELQAFIGFDIQLLPKDRVKEVTQLDPAVLLPLYHQAVQQNIELKNRQSYRLAVRHLKKMRTIYKKVNQVQEWDVFIDRLTQQTKRLRAFQEECKRGKLIHA
jgi:hypothetical protein